MMRLVEVSAIVAAFALAAFVTVRVNATPSFSVTAETKTELDGLLRRNGLATVPMADPKGQIIDAALRFTIPDCKADGFLLPVLDVMLSDVQGMRFTELTGAVYRTSTQTMAPEGGVLRARIARAIAALRFAFGFSTSRNGHTVLSFFTPENCRLPETDMRAFWEPKPEES